MAYCFLFALFGLICGAIIGVLFCQMDPKWKTLCGLGAGGLITSFTIIYNYLSADIDIEKVYLFISFLISLIISSIFIIIITSNSLKKKYKDFKFSFADMVVGRKKTVDEYYKNIQDFINLDYKTKKEELNKLERSLNVKRVELDNRESDINNLQKQLNKQMISALHIKLPINNYVPVDMSLIGSIPTFVENLANFIQELDEVTNMFLDSYNNNDYSSQKEFIISYFRILCLTTSVYLFDTLKDIRTHVRLLTKDNKYEKLVASIGNIIEEKPLTTITNTKNMIYKAGQVRMSLVKSINKKYHQKAKNDDIWTDYLTIVFNDLYLNNKPFISMGISIKDDTYKNCLYLINYCKVELIIQKYLNKINERCNIIKSLEDMEEVS